MSAALSPGNLADLAPAEKQARLDALNHLLEIMPEAAPFFAKELIQLAAPSKDELATQFNNFSVTGRASRHTPPNRR